VVRRAPSPTWCGGRSRRPSCGTPRRGRPMNAGAAAAGSSLQFGPWLAGHELQTGPGRQMAARVIGALVHDVSIPYTQPVRAPEQQPRRRGPGNPRTGRADLLPTLAPARPRPEWCFCWWAVLGSNQRPLRCELPPGRSDAVRHAVGGMGAVADGHLRSVAWVYFRGVLSCARRAADRRILTSRLGAGTVGW